MATVNDNSIVRRMPKRRRPEAAEGRKGEGVTERSAPYDRLLTLARRHTRTRDEAEDLVQAACLAALTSGRRDFGDERVMG